VATSVVLASAVISFVVFWEIKENKENILENLNDQKTRLTENIEKFNRDRLGDVQLAAMQLSKSPDVHNVALSGNISASIKELRGVYYSFKYIPKKDLPQFDNMETLNPGNAAFLTSVDIKGTNPTLTFIGPVLSKNLVIKGYILAEVSLSTITDLIKRTLNIKDKANQGKIDIVRFDGSILYSNHSKAINASVFHNLASQIGEIKDNELVSIDEDYWSVSKIDLDMSETQGQQVYLIVRLNKDEVNASLQRMYQLLLFIFVAITLILTRIGFVIAKKITAPIEDTSRAIEKIGQGDFNSIKAINVSNDEYGVLIHHVQKTTHDLEKLMQERVSHSRMISLGEMAGGIAHEINNPLQLIIGNIKKLERAIKDNDEYEVAKSMGVISNTVFRMAKIVTGLKNCSREGSLDPFELASVKNCIADALLICQEKLTAREVNVAQNEYSSGLQIECRSVQLSQVILNLISNASDAMMKSDDIRWIEINVTEDDSSVCISVNNGGEKISEAIVDRIFTPFFTTKEKEGTGLGLSVSNQIIQSHGGTLSVNMSFKHTCFEIKLPKIQPKGKA
jgi:signal transduction histidine kinase